MQRPSNDGNTPRPVRISRPTLTFFVAVWVVYNLAAAYLKPASTLRGFLAGVFFCAGSWAIYVIWHRPNEENNEDDDDEPAPPVYPPDDARRLIR